MTDATAARLAHGAVLPPRDGATARPLCLAFPARYAAWVFLEVIVHRAFIGGLVLSLAACSASLNVATGGEGATGEGQGQGTIASGSAATRLVDTLVMTSGPERTGRVVAKNEAFYVFEPMTAKQTVEAVEISAVESIKWGAGKEPANLTSFDQIVLANGHLLNGKLAQKKKSAGGYVQLDGWHGKLSYQVHHSQISRVFVAGGESALD